MKRAIVYVAALTIGTLAVGTPSAEPLETPSSTKYTQEDADKMIRSSQERLSTVYAPLADQIVSDFALADKPGIGIDLGSGPGTLITELCRRTKLHWVNADINPHFFPHFFETAQAAGFGHRVSAIFADAHHLPFRDDYADVIVSRGCFFVWEDKPRAFAEIYRVLKPGGVAYIGRGMSRDFPVETAREIRDKQKGKKELEYDPEATALELRHAMEDARIRDFDIECPRPAADPTIHYGVWVTLRKPEKDTP